jgi:hypothetical protein
VMIAGPEVSFVIGKPEPFIGSWREQQHERHHLESRVP